MPYVKSSRSIFASIAAMSVAGVALAGGTHTYEQVIFEFANTAYMGGAPVPITELQIGPAQIIELRWDNVVLETNNNTGISNWGSEAFFGFQAVADGSEPQTVMVQPFPDANEGGTFGPTSGSLEVELSDLFSSPDGKVYLMSASSWVDGSGLPAGKYSSGTISIIYDPIPAPGAIVLLGIAGLAGSRRRRT
jgi:MYXO-CTERM domain-containing protein